MLMNKALVNRACNNVGIIFLLEVAVNVRHVRQSLRETVPQS